MRTLMLILTCVFSASVCSAVNTATVQVRDFYCSYLAAFASESDALYPQQQLRRYVASDTIRRIEEIEAIPEQEILNSDYFTYGQDYDSDWIKALTVGEPVTTPEGKRVPVWIGIEDGKKLHLELFLRREDQAWKIYRVRDVTHHYEQAIFDDVAIARARQRQSAAVAK